MPTSPHSTRPLAALVCLALLMAPALGGCAAAARTGTAKPAAGLSASEEASAVAGLPAKGGIAGWHVGGGSREATGGRFVGSFWVQGLRTGGAQRQRIYVTRETSTAFTVAELLSADGSAIPTLMFIDYHLEGSRIVADAIKSGAATALEFDPVALSKQLNAAGSQIPTSAPTTVSERQAVAIASRAWTSSDSSPTFVVAQQVVYTGDGVKGVVAWIVGASPVLARTHGTSPGVRPARGIWVIDAASGKVISAGFAGGGAGR
jgi:hypothetical protein